MGPGRQSSPSSRRCRRLSRWTSNTAQKAIVQRQIDATDAEIDQLVYDLYGLNEEEIRIVEGGK